MYRREFEQLLVSGKIPKALMLYGQNDYFRENGAKRCIEAVGAQEGTVKLYFDEYDYQTARNTLGQSSLFGDRNLLVVRSEKGVAKNELKELVALAVRNETSYLLYLFHGEDKRAPTDVFKERTKKNEVKRETKVAFVRFFPAKPREAVEAILSEANALGLSMAPPAAEHLARVLEYDIALAVNELRKLAILNGPIGVKEIDEQVHSLASVSTEHFFFDLFAHVPIPQLAEQLAHLGLEEIIIFREAQKFVTRLLRFHLYVKQHGAPDVRAILGHPLPPDLANRYANLAIKLPTERLEAVFDILGQEELRIKRRGGASQKEAVLLATLIKIQSLLR